MGDIFEDIDLNDLANSEEGVIKAGELNTTAPADSPAPSSNSQAQEETTKPVEDPNAVDITALADLEETGEIDTTEVDKEEDDTNIQRTKAPAEQDKGTSPSSQETFTSLASALVEAGVFSSLEEEEIGEIDSAESLLGAIAKQADKARYADLNEDQRNYLEAMENGVSHADYVQYNAEADQYSNLDDNKISEAPALQKELIKRSFLIKGITAEDADKYATLAVNGGTGAEDALKAKQALIDYTKGQVQAKIDASKAEKEAQIAEEKARLEALKSTVKEKSEILPGIKVNSNTRDKVFKSLTTAVEMNGDNPLNDVMKSYSENDEYKLAVHAMHVITKGFTDFSKFTNSKKSSAIKDLERIVNSQGSGKTGSPGAGLQNNINSGATSRQIGEALRKM